MPDEIRVCAHNCHPSGKVFLVCISVPVFGFENRHFFLVPAAVNKEVYMLQVRNVSFIHKKDLRTLVSDFSFTLNSGDKAVIIGEEGNGKSTLLKWIYAPDLVEDYVEVQGQRILGGEVLAYLPQELPENDKECTVYTYFSQVSAFYNLGYDDMRRLAAQVGCQPDIFYSEQKMGTLSGGEKIKIQMLRLLMAGPTVLLLDEPSNDIDIPTLEWLEKLIQSWKGIVLFISHDEVLIEGTANVIIHMEQIYEKKESRCGIFRMPYQEYMEQRAQRFLKQEQQAIWERKEKQIRDEKFRRIAQSVEYAQATISRGDPHGGRLLKKKMHTVKSLEKRFEKEDAEMTKMPIMESAISIQLNPDVAAIPAGKTVLDFQLDSLTVPNTNRVLSKDIHLILKGSEKVCIVGANGAGKTTLLRQISQVLLARKDIQAGYMPQNYEEALDLSMTPVDFLDKTGSLEERTFIRTLLGTLRYTAEEMDHLISDLSGGQKAKILLLQMIRNGDNVLILDEPTRNFSPLSGGAIRDLLHRFPGAIISISHDRKYISEVCDTVYRLTELGLNKLSSPDKEIVSK